MRKLYKALFCIEQQEKISDKVMVMRAFMMILIILASMATMSMSAYAFFTYNISSGTNKIKAASFEVQMTIVEEIVDQPEAVNTAAMSVSQGDAIESITKSVSQGNALESPVQLVTQEEVEEEKPKKQTVIATQTVNCFDGYSLFMKAGNSYTVTLEHADSSTVQTGFVIFSAENCDSKYHTQQISNQSDGNTEPITFSIKPNADTTVTFISHWGTSAYYDDCMNKGDNEELYITSGEDIKLSIKGAVEEKSTEKDVSKLTESEMSASTELPEQDETIEATTETTESEIAETMEEEEQQASKEDVQESSETTSPTESIPVETTFTETMWTSEESEETEPDETIEAETIESSAITEETKLDESIEQVIMEEVQESSETIAATESTPVETSDDETIDMSEQFETTEPETPETQEAVEAAAETESTDEAVLPISEEN